MLITYLGWGSLVWDPRELPVRGRWFIDGPFIPIEFLRQSNDGRLTLVIAPESYPLIRSLWTLCSLDNLEDAKNALADREGIKRDNIKQCIGVWKLGDEEKGVISLISSWATQLCLDAVLWTNLPPKFNSENRIAEASEIIEYLENLPIEKRRNAERYVRNTPLQIDTPIRRLIETRLGWKPKAKY
jgi:hypothetical protein